MPAHLKSLSCSVGAVALAAGLLLAVVPASGQSLGLRGNAEAGPNTTTPALTGAPAQTDPALFDEIVATPPRPAPANRPAAAEEPELRGITRVAPVDGFDEERNARATRDNIRTGAIESRDRRAEDNPYAPLGIRAGTFILTPTLEQGLTWSSNTTSSPGGRQGVLSDTTLRLNAVSDWSRHSASIRGEGNYRTSISGEPSSELSGSIGGDLRLDLGNNFNAQAGLGYRINPESASSPINLGAVTSRPIRQTLTGNAGISRDSGRLRLGLNGALTRDIYGNASLAGGGTLSQRDRNATLATATLRAGYEMSPALRPFVEGEIGRRFYDQTVDANGYARSANRYGLRAGMEFDMGEKLRGEFSAGWLTERPDDARLAAISGPSMAGLLAWSPQRGTTVELSGSTTVESTTSAGETGSLLYSGSLAVSREIRANLTGRALLGLDLRNYNAGGRDTVLRGEASLTWWVNRYAGVTTRARHEMQRSTLAGRNYDATSVFLGMTLQR